MTPTIFCETAQKQFEGVANVKLEAHDLKWAEERKMGSFISVSRGSDEPLRFLELHYNGAANKDEAPLAFVGKGITFDSGGIVSSSHPLVRVPDQCLTGAAPLVAQAGRGHEGHACRHGRCRDHPRRDLGHRQAPDPDQPRPVHSPD